MSDTNPAASATIIPSLRYREAAAAIDWLCDAFGFERHLVVPGEDGGIVHAQLRLGGAMIMLGSGQDGAYDRLVRSPEEAGGVTQSPYVIVVDADALYDRARRVGAEMVLEIEDWDHGGRGFTCRDPEGHIWNFGTYDPWAELAG